MVLGSEGLVHDGEYITEKPEWYGYSPWYV